MSDEGTSRSGGQDTGGQDNRGESVARPRGGFTVSASPLNAVKLDLGVILCVALLVWLMVEYLSDRVAVQVGVLALYGLVAMLWLIVRTRRIETALLALHQGNRAGSLTTPGAKQGDDRD